MNRGWLLFIICTLWSAVAYGSTLYEEPQPECDTMLVSQPKVWGGAHIAFDEELHDFGNVNRNGGDLRWTFEFTNDGEEPLVIMRLTTTCTCLKYDYPRRPISPGETGQINIVYEPHKVEDGNFHRVLQVFSNSVEGRELLFIHGNSIDRKKR